MPTLDWIGKKAVVNHHLRVPYRLLKDVPSLSCGDPGTGNLIVQGDNLLALKALLPFYAGQVKCIYIDPPYNTGHEGWVYNDNVKSPVIQKWLGEVVGEDGETLDRHDRWLCMMYPRLALLRQFLREDGVIFISLDENEAAACRLLMNEIFGSQNFIATIAWQRRTSPDARLGFSQAHDHVLVFGKCAKIVTFNKVPNTQEQEKKFKNPDKDPRGPWVSTDFTAPGWRPNQMYPLTTPGGVTYEPPPGRCWGNIESEYNKSLAEGRMWFGKNGKARPRIKTYLADTEGVSAWSWWPHNETGNNQEAKKEINSIIGHDTPFDTPKPTRLLNRIVQIATKPGDLILDSFAGSGTTGHAVMKMNAEKPEELHRRFVLVEMEPDIARNITSERIRRIAEGYSNAKDERIQGLGGGFRFCELGGELFNEYGQIHDEVTFGELARHVWFTEFHEPLPRERVPNSPFLGECNGVGLYLLYNGILGDKSSNGGNVLTRSILERLPPYDGPKIIFCAGNLLGPDRLRAASITIRQTPYEIKVS